MPVSRYLRAKLEACIATDTTPPPWIVEMPECGRPLGPSQTAFDELKSTFAYLQHTVIKVSRGREKTVRFDARKYGFLPNRIRNPALASISFSPRGNGSASCPYLRSMLLLQQRKLLPLYTDTQVCRPDLISGDLQQCLHAQLRSDAGPGILLCSWVYI